MAYRKKQPSNVAAAAAKRPNRPSFNDPQGCGRQAEPRDTRIEDLTNDRDALACLTIARYFFCSFSKPQSQAWLQAFGVSETAYDHQNGPVIASLVAKVIQAIGSARGSLFHFNSPTCANCAQIVTEHERRFVLALSAVRQRMYKRAELELMLLCEGNSTCPVMMWLSELALALPPLPGHRLN